MSMENLIGKPLPDKEVIEKFNQCDSVIINGYAAAYLRYPDMLHVNAIMTVADARDLRDYLDKVIPKRSSDK